MVERLPRVNEILGPALGSLAGVGVRDGNEHERLSWDPVRGDPQRRPSCLNWVLKDAYEAGTG